MRLLFSLTYYFPYSSGLTLYVKRLGEALVKEGFDITVLTMNFDKHCRSAEIVNRVKVVRADYLAKISKGFLSFDWLIKSWQEVKKADAVFINLPQFEGIIPALFAKIFAKKVISIYHCEVVLPPGLINRIIQIKLTASNFLTLFLSDRIVTYTEDFARYSRVLSHFKGKLQFIYPPIIEQKINKRVQNDIREKIYVRSHPGKPRFYRGVSRIPNGFWTSQNDELFIIGVAARLAAEKGMEYLLEAIPEIESRVKSHSGERSDSRITSNENDSGQARMTIKNMIRIVIAGSMEPVGEENYKRKILKLVEKYKDCVGFLGELKEEDMGAFYSLLDVLVLPSINSTEAFGMVQVEAMTMGVPVVASDLAGVRIPIQKTGMGILVPAKNSQKLAEAIVEVLLNRKKYIKSKELVEKEFSFQKTIELYKKLLS